LRRSETLVPQKIVPICSTVSYAIAAATKLSVVPVHLPA
jgi:hypothetical protein